MFFVLLTIFFLRDGSKQTLAEPVNSPSVAACEAKANQYAKDFHGHTDEAILGVGFSCSGPFDDPLIPKKKA